MTSDTPTNHNHGDAAASAGVYPTIYLINRRYADRLTGAGDITIAAKAAA